MLIIQIAAVPLLIGNLIAIQTVSSSLDAKKQRPSDSATAIFFPHFHYQNNNYSNNTSSTRTTILPHATLLGMPNFILDKTSLPNVLILINASSVRKRITEQEATEDSELIERNQTSKQTSANYNNVQFEDRRIFNRKLEKRSPSSLLYSFESYTRTTGSNLAESEQHGMMAHSDSEESVVNKTNEIQMSQNMSKSTTTAATLDDSSSSSEDSSDVVPSYMKHMTITLVILHMFVFITGLVGNSLVCLSVYRNKSLQTVTNYYIVNLAVADFLVILICLPPTVYWDLTLTWNFGLVLCKLVLYLQSISVSVSVLTLTCISIDRWYAICRPLEFSSTKYRAKITIVLIWIVSMLIASPDVIFLTTRPLYEENSFVYMDCTYTWPESNTKMYQLCIVTLLFIGPFVLMSISYSHIVNVLWRNETMADSLHHTSIQLEEEQQFLKRKYESMSAIHENGDPACGINHNNTDNNKNKSLLATVTSTAAEVDHIDGKENNVSNREMDKRNEKSKSKIKHEKQGATQSNDITTNMDLGTSLKSTGVANEMGAEASNRALYTHAIDQAFSKQQDSNCYQTCVTREADAMSCNKPDWRSTQMYIPNCKRKMVQRKLSVQEANTRYSRELMPMATTNLNPSNKRRHTIESHNHEHYVCCCENNDARRCNVEDHASTFIECLVSSYLGPQHLNLNSKSLSIDNGVKEASKSKSLHPKLAIDICTLDHENLNMDKVNNLASGSLDGEKTNFKFNTEQSVGVNSFANGEAIELGAEKPACIGKSIEGSSVDDGDEGNKRWRNLVADDVDGSKIETRRGSKISLGQLKVETEFNAIKGAASPKFTEARQKTTACFQSARFAKEICSAPKVVLGNRHISKNLCHEITNFGSGKNLEPEKLISATIVEKKVRKNLATSLVVDMSFEATTTTDVEKPGLVDYKELNDSSSDRGSGFVGCSADNKKHDSELKKEEEQAVSSKLMTNATTTNTHDSATNGEEVIENSTLKATRTNSNFPNCCECFMDSLRRKSDKLKADKSLKKYRKNLANYAANKERYRDTTNSSRITRQTMFTSSFLKGDQLTTNSSGYRKKNNNSREQANQSSSTRCYLNVETSTNISKGLTNREQQNSGYSSHSATTLNDQSPSMVSNNFNHQQPHAPYNTRFYKLIESRKKAAKMLIVIVIMFGLCYLPIHFLNILRYTIGLPQNDITTIASLVSHWLCYFNSAINPLIYNLMSGKRGSNLEFTATKITMFHSEVNNTTTKNSLTKQVNSDTSLQIYSFASVSEGA